MALFGLIKKKSKSSSSFNQTQVTRNQILGETAFQELFSGAATAAGQIDTGGITGAANALFQSGGDILGGIRSQALGQDVGGIFQAGRITGQGSLLQENISQLQADFGRLFSEEFLPAIAGEAVGGGQLGGGRQGVAQGAAIRSLSEEFGRAELGLRTSELEARSQAARDLQASQLGAAGLAPQALETQFGLAEAGALAPLSPSLLLSQILGQPTILSSTVAQAGTSKTKGSATQFGAEFGSS